MTETTSKSKFKPKTLEYLRKVEETGETLIITDRGRPVVKIEPYRAGDALRFLRGCVLRYDDPTEPVAAEEWEVEGAADR
ncbi:MAG: type II toxin-antitoxin system prevent-host-death family antitoxin [Trueperaceae bacterium]